MPGGGARYRWTEEETQLVQELASTHTYSQIQAALKLKFGRYRGLSSIGNIVMAYRVGECRPHQLADALEHAAELFNEIDDDTAHWCRNRASQLGGINGSVRPVREAVRTDDGGADHQVVPQEVVHGGSQAGDHQEPQVVEVGNAARKPEPADEIAAALSASAI